MPPVSHSRDGLQCCLKPRRCPDVNPGQAAQGKYPPDCCQADRWLPGKLSAAVSAPKLPSNSPFSLTLMPLVVSECVKGAVGYRETDKTTSNKKGERERWSNPRSIRVVTLPGRTASDGNSTALSSPWWWTVNSTGTKTRPSLATSRDGISRKEYDTATLTEKLLFPFFPRGSPNVFVVLLRFAGRFFP